MLNEAMVGLVRREMKHRLLFQGCSGGGNVCSMKTILHVGVRHREALVEGMCEMSLDMEVALDGGGTRGAWFVSTTDCRRMTRPGRGIN